MSILRADIDKLQDNLHNMELTSKKTLRDLIMYVCWVKEDYIIYMYTQDWVRKWSNPHLQDME